MKILILNGNSRLGSAKFDAWLDELAVKLSAQGHKTVMFQLRERKVEFCIGCYACWLKTPGICIHKDDMPEILREYVGSDLVIYASPLIMGDITHLLKTVRERLLPTILPYLCIKGNRMQHPKRYDKTPSTALLLGEDENPADLEIVREIFTAAKMNSVSFVKTMDSPVVEVVNAINCI